MNQYKELPVLITGGCGFIGSHLAKTLVQLGADVTIIDNGLTGNTTNIAEIKDSVTVINHSITDPHACLEATQGKKIVFHTAALVSVPLSMENPSLCHQINVEGTFNLLEASRLHGVERFIFSSSAAVYGPQQGLCSELNECLPESPYGYSKLMGEMYCKQYAQLYDLQTLSLRYFNVWGEGQNPHGPYAAAVANFRERMRHNESIIVYGDGLQTRDFIHVNDVVQANITLGMLAKEQMMGDVYNIASGTSITLLELIEILKQEFPEYDAPIIFEPSRAGDLKHSAADCSKYVTMTQKVPGI